MSEQLQELVRRYQAGEDVRGEIERGIFEEEIAEKVLNIYTWLSEYDADREILKKSIDYALKKYEFNKKMTFSSYLHMIYSGRLKNEEIRQETEDLHRYRATIKDKEAYLEATETLRENYNDEQLFNDCEYITEEEFLEMSDREHEYLKITMHLARENKSWRDDTAAAEVLGVNPDTIRRYKERLQKILLKKYEGLREQKRKRGEAAKIIDDLQNRPFKDLTEDEKELVRNYSDNSLSLFNEHGLPDPTPLMAIKRIKYGAPIDENQFDLIPESMKDNSGTMGTILTPRADVEPVENGYCDKCYIPLTTEGKCSNTNICKG